MHSENLEAVESIDHHILLAYFQPIDIVRNHHQCLQLHAQ